MGARCENPEPRKSVGIASVNIRRTENIPGGITYAAAVPVKYRDRRTYGDARLYYFATYLRLAMATAAVVAAAAAVAATVATVGNCDRTVID